MKMPIHRRKFKDSHTGEIHTACFNGWIGSGVNDKNGKEIFEGDKILYNGTDIFSVEFKDGNFFAINYLLELPLGSINGNTEIINEKSKIMEN